MNSYDRFNAVLEHKKPDRLPLYIPTVACSVASEIIGRDADTGGDSLHFKEELSRLQGENAHREFLHKFQEDTIELYRKLKVDVIRETWRCKGRPSKKLDEHTLLFGDENGPHTIKRFFPKYQSYGVVESVGAPRDVEELKQVLLREMKQNCSVSQDELHELYRDQLTLKKMAEPYMPAIAGALGIGFPMDQVVWLEATVLEPGLLCEYFLFQTENAAKHIQFLRKQGYRFINGGADIATGTGPVVSPGAFQAIFVPALRRLADECRKHGMMYCYRTDGNTWKIADSLFLDAGIQAYGEVDRDASMTVGRLRSRYPGVFILGNVSSAALSTCSEEEIRKVTRATLEEAGGSHYIAGPSNAVVHGTPVNNLLAMIDEVIHYKL
jgi:hypothetical protein